MPRQRIDAQPGHSRLWSRWFVALTATCALTIGGNQLPAADDVKPTPQADAKEKARLDLNGDPLPPGALVRLGTLRWRHGAPVTYVAFTADGKAVLTASQDNLVRLWDMATGKEIRRFGKQQVEDPKMAGNAPAQLRQALLRVRGGYGAGPGVVLSADGKTLATVTQIDTIQLWEVTTGKELRQLKVTPGSAGGLLLSADGKILVGRGNDQMIRVWETSTGKELRAIQGKQNDPVGKVFVIGNVFGAGLSADGKTVAAVQTLFANQKITTSVTLWDTGTGKELYQIETNNQGSGPSALAFSPDGKVLACAGRNAIQLYAADTGKEIRQIAGQAIGITTLLFSPDGKTLAVRGAQDRLIRLCSVETGKTLQQLGEPMAGRGVNVAFSVAAGGFGRDLAFSPDGKLVAAGDGHLVRFWVAETGKEVVQVSGHRDQVTDLMVTWDGNLVASKGADNVVRLWEAATGKERHQFRAPSGTTCVAFAPDASIVALGNLDGVVRLHEVATGKELRRAVGHRNGIVAVAFSPDGKTVASRGANDNTIRLFETATARELRVITLQAPQNPAAGKVVVVFDRFGFGSRVGLAFSPDGKTVASTGPGGFDPRFGGPGQATQPTLGLWDVTTGKEIRKLLLPIQYSLVSFAFSPDGHTLATENADQTITLWESASGKERGRLGKAPQAKQPAGGMPIMVGGGFGMSNPASLTLAFASDGRTLACRGPDRAVCVWDVAAGKELGQLKGHDGNVTALAFGSDGKTVVSGSSDTTVLIWDATRFGPAARPQPAKLSPADVEALWADLAGADAVQAFRAIQTLTTAPEQVVPFLRERLRPAAPLDAAKICKLVADLDSRQFSARQRATSELEKVGELAVPALQEALKAEPSLETRKRVEQLLEKLAGAILSDEQLRLVRALEVLEQLRTPEAFQVLETLSGGAPGALPTREAQAALNRLIGHRRFLPPPNR